MTDPGSHAKTADALLAVLEQRIRATEARLRALEESTNGHSARIVALETGHKTLADAVAEVRSELKLLREDADAIKAELLAVGVKVAVVGTRVAKLELRLAGWFGLVYALCEWFVPWAAKAMKGLAFGG